MQLQTGEPLQQIMLARYYGDAVPRFLSPDPIGGSAPSPQSWNRYAYVLGNPMKLVDPTGMYWAPGTTPPGHTGPAGPWGPCLMCHDFIGGSAGDAVAAFANQRRLHDRIEARLKAFASQNFSGANILQSLTPGNGATVTLGVDLGGHLGHTDSKTSISLSILPSGDDDKRFQATLIHETGHWMSLMTFGLLSKDSVVPKGIQDAIYKQAITGAEEFQIMKDGYVGLAFEQLQFGGVVTWQY